MEQEVATIRRLFPNADERVEVVGRVPQGNPPGVEVRRPVFRCSFSSLPAALEACQQLPNTIGVNVGVQTVLDELEIEALARHHIDGFLHQDRWLHFLRHEAEYYRGEDPEYKPCGYDDLPWPAEFAWFCSDLREAMYHLRRLAFVESILGRDRVRNIYEAMATHPPEELISDFDTEGPGA